MGAGARIARFASRSQSSSRAVGNALASAATNQVNGENTIAGQRAYARMQAALKAALIKKYSS